MLTGVRQGDEFRNKGARSQTTHALRRRYDHFWPRRQTSCVPGPLRLLFGIVLNQWLAKARQAVSHSDGLNRNPTSPFAV